MGLLRKDSGAGSGEPAPAPPPPAPPPVQWAECPKCASSDVVWAQHGVGFDPWNYIQFGVGLTAIKGWASWLCLDCGYTETYVTERDKLDQIRANPADKGWNRASGA